MLPDGYEGDGWRLGYGRGGGTGCKESSQLEGGKENHCRSMQLQAHPLNLSAHRREV